MGPFNLAHFLCRSLERSEIQNPADIRDLVPLREIIYPKCTRLGKMYYIYYITNKQIEL